MVHVLLKSFKKIFFRSPKHVHIVGVTLIIRCLLLVALKKREGVFAYVDKIQEVHLFCLALCVGFLSRLLIFLSSTGRMI